MDWWIVFLLPLLFLLLDDPTDCLIIKRLNSMRQFPGTYDPTKKPTDGEWGAIPKQLYQYQLFARSGRTLHVRVFLHFRVIADFCCGEKRLRARKDGA